MTATTAILAGLLASLAASAGGGGAPSIDVYTMGQGDELFTHFGHSAICVTDEVSPEGRCYNYGTADFSTPVPLTIEFLRGRARFWVSRQDPARMVAAYAREDRTVWRQRLPLSPEQHLALSTRLERAASTEERYYRYHHFEDNCTTRIRDLVDEVLGGALGRDTRDRAERPSFREYARAGFAGDAPLLVAADLVLGRARDRATTRWESMFLPELLRDELEVVLGARPEVVHQRRSAPAPRPNWTGRALLVAAGIVLSALALLFGSGRRALGVAAVLPAGLVLGAAGLGLWSLAALSAFEELRANEALLVLWPTDLALPLLASLSPGRLLALYVRARLISLGVVACLSALGVLVQPLWAPLLLVVLPLGVLHVRTRRPPARR